jgi:outer membrane protein
MKRLQRSVARCALGLASAFGMIGAASAQEEATPPGQPQLPLWELRLGGAALYAPDYPGSEDSHWRGIGAPLFVYRGERIRIGSDEPTSVARAIAVETRRFELDLSVDANYGAESDDNEARTGMPDLETQLEIGPQLTLNIADTGWNEEGRRRLRLLLPVRHVGATDFQSYDELGFLFQPTLTYRRQWPGDRRMSFSTSFAGTWATEGVQDYYYQVDAPYATADRPAYDAQGGYLGAHIQVSGVREIKPGLNVYLTYRVRNLSGAANADSPMHRADTTQAFSVSVVWTALRSSRPAANGER